MECIFLEVVNNKNIVKTTSDFMLLQNETGLKYANPVDIGEFDIMWKPKYFTYTETNEPIPQENI